jgi:hypothetical protein
MLSAQKGGCFYFTEMAMPIIFHAFWEKLNFMTGIKETGPNIATKV